MFWKILNLLFGKRRNKRPLSATEIIRRGPKMEYYNQWSRSRHILVFNPPFWGIHDIYVDSSLRHAVFCLKEDMSAFVFLGDTKGANSFTRYDREQQPVEKTILNEGDLVWTIYDDYVIYRGSLLPVSAEPYYWGRIVGTSDFVDNINEEWITQNLKILIDRAFKNSTGH